MLYIFEDAVSLLDGSDLLDNILRGVQINKALVNPAEYGLWLFSSSFLMRKILKRLCCNIGRHSIASDIATSIVPHRRSL